MRANSARQKPGLLVVAERQKDCVNFNAVPFVELWFHEHVNDGAGFNGVESVKFGVLGKTYDPADHFQNPAVLADKQKFLAIIALAADIVNVGSQFPP